MWNALRLMKGSVYKKAKEGLYPSNIRSRSFEEVVSNHGSSSSLALTLLFGHFSRMDA